MFRHTIPIGRVLGISVDLDYSWFLILVLLTWMLAVAYYPAEIRHGTSGQYWLMSLVTAVFFFASILVHELAHSWVALGYKIPVRRITLFIFGGISQIAGEPPNAGAEFFIAVVGPITSFVLAGIFFLLESLLVNDRPALAVAKYLAWINCLLGLFNVSVWSSPLVCSRGRIDYESWLILVEWCLGIALAGGMHYLRSGAWWS